METQLNTMQLAEMYLGTRLHEKNGSYYLDGHPVKLLHIMQATNRVLISLGKAQIVKNPAWAVEEAEKPSSPQKTEQPKKILLMTIQEVEDATGLHPTIIYKMIKSGNFPTQIKKAVPNSRRVFWNAEDVKNLENWKKKNLPNNKEQVL